MNSSVDKDNSPEDGFEEVVSKNKKNATVMATLVSKKANKIGICFTRVGDNNSSAFTQEELNKIIKLVGEVDNTAVLMPFNCNINQAISIRKAATGDWVAFGDIKNTRWGTDMQNQFKAHFTIWIASDSIGRNLRTLKEHLPLSGYLKTVNIQMRPHNLRESVSKSVGFLLGANPEKTYRIGVTADMEAHLKTHKVPPFNVQRTTVRCGTTRSDTLSMFVGEKDLNRVTEILKKHPFKGPQIIFSDTKSNKEDFEKNLKVNNEIKKRCGAVKVIGANGDIIEALKTVAEQNKALNIIHISTTSHTKDTGTIYVVCLMDKKDEVHQFIQQSIQNHCTNNPDIQAPIIVPLSRDDRTVQTQQTRATKATTITKFDFLLSSAVSDQTQQNPMNTTRPSIPTAIVATNSYAAIVAGAKSNQSDNESQSNHE
ncbi:hypothetical protein (Partial), partial [Seminavis robusta]|eukprot:Sro653_g181970.1 n/a (426) ;mRNA; f:53438-54716